MDKLQKININVNQKKVPTALKVLQECCKSNVDVNFKHADKLSLNVGGYPLNGVQDITKYLARLSQHEQTKKFLFEGTLEEKSQIDAWTSYSSKMNSKDISSNINFVNEALKLKTFLVGERLTLADVLIWSAFTDLPEWKGVVAKMQKSPDNLIRWYNYLQSNPPCNKFSQSNVKASKSKEDSSSGKQADEAKYMELEGAEDGKVVVRFPPEAGGYLHIGHAKAALLSNAYKLKYNGKLIFRFDDTNPEKEKIEYEKAILEDIKSMTIEPDFFTRTSDHFEKMIELVEKLLKEGHVYADDCTQEVFKEQRMNKQPSSNRNNSVDKNWKMWQEMKTGSKRGQEICLRAKIDYKSDNGALRDPVVYRVKINTPHPATGTKYKVYPTYDFACPIVDSFEGVTHALRTTEYLARDEQFQWFIEKMKLRPVKIKSYSRLNLVKTLLSKRKLTYFVQEGIVDGWDDPRMPTVKGILRRGMKIEGLKKFIASVGSSTSNVFMEWDKIWNFNKQVIDPVAHRYLAVPTGNTVPVKISGLDAEKQIDVDLHPKDPSLGKKRTWVSKTVLVEKEDANEFVEGSNVTFINWGNIMITRVIRNENNQVTEIQGQVNTDDKNFKKTHKVHWVSSGRSVPCICMYYSDLLTKEKIEADDDWKQLINFDSKKVVKMQGEVGLTNIKKDDIIQIQRKGYFRCDQEYSFSKSSSLETPLVLIKIPDGKTKETQLTGAKKAKTSTNNANNDRRKEKKAAKQKSTSPAATQQSSGDADLYNKVTQQGDNVRQLKSDKADKAAISAAVKVLLELKADYKKKTGQDYKPGQAPKPAQLEKNDKSKATGDAKIANMDLYNKVTEQGNKIRTLKAAKASADQITAEVNVLKQLKSDYKQSTGEEYVGPNQQGSKKSSGSKKKEVKKPQIKKEVAAVSADAGKKQTRLCIEAKKNEDLPEWYKQILVKSDLIDYYDVSGCYILMPWSYSIWERIKKFFDDRIKKMGVKNCYFPIFVTEAALQREKDHIEDFAPEVAWVTRSGNTELEKPIAIRPTSETAMYPAYAKRVQSHRDLPIRLNQWCNVVRWEFKHPQPFLRTREFLWQEGHSAFATYPEAEKEVYEILEHYAAVYEKLLAIPVVRGKKTEKEKFAGGDYTTTVEAYIPASGRAIQGATSHHLGQNFSKMFDISFEDPNKAGEKAFAYQNSWGITTRTIGVLVMVHGDDKGLVLPPRVAEVQVVIVACGITAKSSADERANISNKCEEYKQKLEEVGIRCEFDDRDNYSPGWKFNHWELKGVPVRLEVGPKDLQSAVCKLVVRRNGEKLMCAEASVQDEVLRLMEKIQQDMYDSASEGLSENMVVADNWDDFCKYLDEGKLIQAPFCGDKDAEASIKKNSARDQDVDSNAPSMGAKSLCIPLKPLKQLQPGTKCISGNGKEATCYCLFGRSY